MHFLGDLAPLAALVDLAGRPVVVERAGDLPGEVDLSRIVHMVVTIRRVPGPMRLNHGGMQKEWLVLVLF